MTELLSRLISLLPDSPGVYLMKNGDGEIIYIGKAKSLKKRVSQYFLRPQIGKVKAGMNADLLIVEGNPLSDISDIRNTRLVLKDGEIVARGEKRLSE